jgi:hypothetical protein
MTSVRIRGESLEIEAGAPGEFWNLRSRMTIPLTHVLGAERETAAARRWLQELGGGAAAQPRVLSPGRFHPRGEWVFWDVGEPGRAVGIELEAEPFTKLIVEVEDPDAVVEAINRVAERRARAAAEAG